MEEIIKLITESPTGLLIYLLLINLITFCTFAVDKFQAISDGWRISERTLLGVSVLGGATGGWIAMQVCRHKTRKPIFKYGLPMMVAIHIAILTIL